jgi:hypothetical protein
LESNDVDRIDGVSVAELELDGSANGKTSVWDFSTEKNSVIVSILGSVVLQEEDVSETGGSRRADDGSANTEVVSSNGGGAHGKGWVFLDELFQTLGRNGEIALLSNGDDVGEGGSDEGVSGGAEEVIADGEDVS